MNAEKFAQPILKKHVSAPRSALCQSAGAKDWKKKGIKEKMELIIYEGKLPDPRRLEELAKQTAAAYDLPDIRIAHCTTEQELTAAITRIAAWHASQSVGIIPFRTRTKTHLLRLDNVRLFRSADHHLYALLTNGTELCSRTMRISARAALETYLTQHLIFQVSKSTFVNLAHVRTVSLDGVHMDDDSVVSISRKYYAEFLAWSR